MEEEHQKGKILLVDDSPATVEIMKAALEEESQAIIRAKQEWERTFDAASELIMILDREYRIVRANTAIAEKVDLTPQALIGRTYYTVFHGSQEPLPFCPHTQLMADGRKLAAEIHEENLDADFLVSVSPLYDADGQLTGSVFLGMLRERIAATLGEHSQHDMDVDDNHIPASRSACGKREEHSR